MQKIRAADVIPTEHEEQVTLVNWFRWKFPGVLIHAIPNGAHLAGSTRLRQAKVVRMKQEGLVPGVPDLHVPAWDLWIEMKRRKGGRLSEDQREQIAYLQSIGDTVLIAEGVDDAVDQITALRARQRAEEARS
jgi:hypothetical protein